MPNLQAANFDFSKVADEEGFLEEFFKETDRGAALVGAAFLEFKLSEVIKNFIIDTKKADEVVRQEFDSFRSKIRIAYVLGLINEDEYAEIGRIKTIRDHFAHRLQGLSFDERIIKEVCGNLCLLRERGVNKTSREQYVLTIYILVKQMEFRAEQVKSQRRELPSAWFEVQL